MIVIGILMGAASVAGLVTTAVSYRRNNLGSE